MLVLKGNLRDYLLHCKKKVCDFPFPSWGKILLIPGQGEFGCSDIRLGTGKSLTFFTVANISYFSE